MTTWNTDDAANAFETVVERATSEGPQHIAVRGNAVAVLLSCGEYQRLVGSKPGFVEFMRRSPLMGLDLDLERE